MKKRLLNKIALGIACLLGIGVSFISTPTDMNAVYAAESDYRTEQTVVKLRTQSDSVNFSQKTFTEDAAYGGAVWLLTHTPTTDDHQLFQMSASQTFKATRQTTARYITDINSFYFTRGSTSWSGNLSVKVKIGGTEIYTASSASVTDYDLSVYNRAVSGELSGTLTIEASSTSSSTWYFGLRFVQLKGYVYKSVSSTLNDNGGSGGQGTVGLTYGEAMPNVTVPSKTGYRFDGYYIGTKQYYKGDGTPAISSFDVKSDSITLTAKWTLMQFDVTLNKQGGTGGDDGVVAIYGDAMPTATMPTRTGYNFLGYFDETSGGKQYYNADGSSATTFDKTEDSTLYAQWECLPVVQNVIDKINNIGDIGLNDACKGRIDEARSAYNALNSDLKEVVVNEGYYKVLVDAEATYQALFKIEAIKSSANTSEYNTNYLAAKEVYDALSEDQKDLVPESFKKDLVDAHDANEVMKAIDAIGEVSYNKGTDDSLAPIVASEEAYAKLTDEQKAIVDKYNHTVLVEDRTSYDKVDNVYNLIEAIGDVELNETSKEKIDLARSEFDKLSESEKALVKKNNYQTLDDGEHVYHALEIIDKIGDVEYTSESKALIEEARAYYDSLSDEQKARVGASPLEKLEAAEVSFTELNKSGTTMSIVFLIFAGLLLIAGLFVMYRLLRKKKDKGVKAKSVSILAPAILTSLYVQGGFLVLYIILGLAALVWLADLIIFLVKKHGKSIVVEGEANNANEESSEVEESEEVETITDENGNKFIIRYIKSFLAKLIQSSDETKGYYEELKNFALSYEGTASRVSWNYDSINVGKVQFLKFGIRGKTLCLYLPLNPEELDEKYKVERIESLKYEKVPCMYRINNERRIRYAKTLIRMVASKLKIKLGEEKHESYVLPYEDRDALVAKGLIRMNKSLADKPEEEVLSIKEDEEGNEIITTQDTEGHIYETRLVKSFTARFIQADDEVKAVYNELKNYALSYDKASARLSWLYDSINVSKESLLKFNIKRGVLCIYYALDITKLGEKYKVEKADAKKYSKVPCLYKVNARRINYAKELIDRVMRKNKLVKDKELNDSYILPYEEKDALIKKGYIRESKIRIK